MEAAVAEREVEMVEWDDGRLDERFRAIDQRFDQVDQKMDEGFARVDKGFARMEAAFRDLNGRFDAMQRTLLGMSGVIIAALIGLIATQL
ncbi:MAG TPA: hypothetical protein VFU16_05880 [Solirubrobacterales bacterium]|nr:hypothetical protein [Solirubrobacterales bacterium]